MWRRCYGCGRRLAGRRPDLPDDMAVARCCARTVGIGLRSKIHTRASQVGARRSRFVAPQPAALVEHAPEEGEWVHEPSVDAYRLLHRIRDGTVTLWTGNGHEWTATRQSLTDARAGLPAERTWLDGARVADSLPALIGLVHLGSWNSTHEGAARSAGSPRLPGVRSRSRAGRALKPGRVGGILSAAPFRSGGPLETPAPRAAARQGSPAGLPVRPADDHSLHAGSIQAITVGSLP